MAVSKSFGNGVKSAHTPLGTYSTLGKKLHVVRDSCAKDMKRKRNSAMDRNEMNRHGVEWSGIISGEMLARKFDALTFHVKARSIDKLIRIRP